MPEAYGQTPQDSLYHIREVVVTGRVVRREVIPVQELSGERLQSPPVYSAKKIDGMRAYELARAGEEVEMRKALVHIYEMQL